MSAEPQPEAVNCDWPAMCAAVGQAMRPVKLHGRPVMLRAHARAQTPRLETDLLVLFPPSAAVGTDGMICIRHFPSTDEYRVAMYKPARSAWPTLELSLDTEKMHGMDLRTPKAFLAYLLAQITPEMVRGM